ncbi:MAG: hypothetical protein ACR2QW_12320, partial [bacterium]
IESMQRIDSAGEVSLIYSYDWENNVVHVNGTDGSSLSMHYDAQGNLLEKNNNGELTVYSYTTKGEVSSRVKESNTTQYRYSEDGLVTSIEDSNGTSELAYNAIGRISQVTFADGTTHSYQYDLQGFRTRTDRSAGPYINYEYDVSGNLINMDSIDAEGSPSSQSIETDEGNKVTLVDFGGESQLQIDYDENGQPAIINDNNVLTEYHYDSIGRLVSVIEDGGYPVTYEYNAAEPDIRLTLDDRTKATKQSGRVSQLGDTEAIWYTRLLGSAWGSVGMDTGTLALTLVAAEGFSMADAVQIAAEQRRRWRDLAGGQLHNKEGFDKPSSSLFLPAEYATVNCFFCYPPFGIYLSIPSNIIAGQSANLTASAVPIPNDCSAMGYLWYIDGEFVETAFQGELAYTFPSAATYLVSVTGVCAGICIHTSIGYEVVTVSNPCEGEALDTYATAWLEFKSLRPYERGTSFYCSSNNLNARQTVSSEDDKCTFALPKEPGDVGWAHLHPFFIYNASSTEEVICNGETIQLNNFNEVNSQNISGNYFSEYDEWISSPSYPGYLKGPNNQIQKCTGQNCAL